MTKKSETKTQEEKIEANVPTEEKKSLTGLLGFDMNDFVAQPCENRIILKKDITRIPVGRPNNQVFFRINPTLELPVYLLKWNEDGERYLVHKNALQFLPNLTQLNILYLGMYQSGNPFFYPLPQRDEKGKWNSWHESGFTVIQEAKKRWVRAVPERAINGYTIVVALNEMPEPIWPEKTLQELLEIAFRERIIRDENHPLVKQLKGLTQ